jgi:c-di-GMP-binding flagellar brake protein YcgR
MNAILAQIGHPDTLICFRFPADKTFVMNDRRFDVRVPVADTVSLCWTDQTGEKQQDPADLADISRSGASVRSQHPVKIGTTIFLVYQDQEFAGKVRSCVSGPTGYVLGIEFDDGYRWKPRP